MSFPDESLSWPGYPGIAQNISTKVQPDQLSKTDRVANGDFRVTYVSQLRAVKITVVHDLVNIDDKERILEFYENKGNSRFDFLYHGDLKIYTCAFTQQPTEVWLSSGSDGTGLWNITSNLIGIFKEQYVG